MTELGMLSLFQTPRNPQETNGTFGARDIVNALQIGQF
jgi:hypothetical protein